MTPFAACPVPSADRSQVLLSHGGGGRLMHQLLEEVFYPAFANPLLDRRHDGAVIPKIPGPLAFTTDSYVVRPLFFPGGDIGSLAVNGTANDLAMCGARARWLSAAFILEEGLPMETLSRVVRSMRIAAEAAGVMLVTGDTKVVDRGKADGLYVATTGIGTVESPGRIGPERVQPGDAVLVSGDLARHGMAVMSVREGLGFESAIESDCAPLWPLVEALLEAGIEIHCLRDLTRGGLASALNEIASGARARVDLDGGAVPVDRQVQGACEILGLDPLYVANEGRFVAFVPHADATRALHALKAHPEGRAAAIIGGVREGGPGLVTVSSPIGGSRILDMLSGEQLPRIC